MYTPIDFSDRKSKGFILETLFIRIDTETNTSEISFELNPNLKPLIIDLSLGYTSYYIENILRLDSSYSTRIYQLLKQYESIGFRTISIIDLKYFLSISKDKYKKYNDFKKKVIIPTQKEIKQKTDIYFTFKEIKTGRKITSIKFIIFENKKIIELKKEKDKVNLEAEKKEIYDKLISLKISKPKALELCKSVDKKQINNNIRHTENEIKKGIKIPNPAGFLIKAIENDYYNQGTLFNNDQEENKRIKAKEKEEQEQLKRELESDISTLKKEFYRQEREVFLTSLSNEEQQELLIILKDSFEDGIIKKLIKDLLSPFLMPKIVDLIDGYEIKEQQYIKNNL
jgi:hypothetical protein